MCTVLNYNYASTSSASYNANGACVDLRDKSVSLRHRKGPGHMPGPIARLQRGMVHKKCIVYQCTCTDSLGLARWSGGLGSDLEKIVYLEERQQHCPHVSTVRDASAIHIVQS